MKYFLLFIFLFISLTCTSQTQSDAQLSEIGPGKILIVYLSRTENTKAVAEMIHEKVGGTLVSLELETQYP